MITSPSASRPLLRALRSTRCSKQYLRQVPLQKCKYSQSPPRARNAVPKWILTVPVIGLFVLSDIYRQHADSISLDAPSANDQPAILIEQSRKREGASKEGFRDLISSQHLQVKKSWENPGVYAWGSNTGKVVAPDSEEVYIKTPRRIPFFDDLLLRDLKLDRNFGVAITEAGDLLQWGKGYSETEAQPRMTLRGKSLISLAISRDRILALSQSGKVYSVPVSRSDQEGGHKPSEASWIPFWKSRASISYRLLQPETLAFGEKFTAISGGLDHAILLTNSGRVFTAASSFESYPIRGQLGIPGLTWATRPHGAHDMCHEVTTLKGFDIMQVSAGDYHSLAVDKEGRMFSFGDNSCGQLGFEYSSESPYIDAPSLLPVSRLYQGTKQVPRVTAIAAGGTNSFFTVDATRVLGQNEDPSEVRTIGRITADTWACGQGIRGALGNGRWTHIQGTPTKVPALSGLFEYNEKSKTVAPIRLSRISVGQSHVSAVMANVTYLNASDTSSEHDVNWGADALWWGANDYYQLGTGKRNNINTPMYIAPLDADAEKAAGRDQTHRFQITPRHKVRVKGQKVEMEQKIECGRQVTAVYSAA